MLLYNKNTISFAHAKMMMMISLGNFDTAGCYFCIPWFPGFLFSGGFGSRGSVRSVVADSLRTLASKIRITQQSDTLVI